MAINRSQTNVPTPKTICLSQNKQTTPNKNQHKNNNKHHQHTQIKTPRKSRKLRRVSGLPIRRHILKTNGASQRTLEFHAENPQTTRPPRNGLTQGKWADYNARDGNFDAKGWYPLPSPDAITAPHSAFDSSTHAINSRISSGRIHIRWQSGGS